MIADLIILAIVGICVIVGYKKGLVEVGFKLISFILAIIIALMFYEPVANFIIEKTEFDESIQQTIQQNIGEKKLEEISVNENEEIPEIITKQINNTIIQATNSAKESVATLVSQNLAVLAIKIISIIGLFIVARILLFVVRKITNLIAKLPLIKSINKLGGVIYGVAEGIIIVYAILAIITGVIALTGNDFMLEYINNSSICKAMYNNNILFKIVH